MLLGGLAPFTLGGGLALVSTPTAVLICARIIQGAGGGAGPAIAQAIQ